MTRTRNYDLNKPEPTDPLRAADFNENADRIDAALSDLHTAMGQLAVPRIAVGTYIGTGANATQTITLGFRPKAVIAWGNRTRQLEADNYSFSAMAVDGTPYVYALEIVDGGFTAKCVTNGSLNPFYPDLNRKDLTYLYLAIG